MPRRQRGPLAADTPGDIPDLPSRLLSAEETARVRWDKFRPALVPRCVSETPPRVGRANGRGRKPNPPRGESVKEVVVVGGKKHVPNVAFPATSPGKTPSSGGCGRPGTARGRARRKRAFSLRDRRGRSCRGLFISAPSGRGHPARRSETRLRLRRRLQGDRFPRSLMKG